VATTFKWPHNSKRKAIQNKAEIEISEMATKGPKAEGLNKSI